ncbi:MAG: roadblock/LC7 domain-containing protein [Streptosporangiaceae bacterium]
MPEIPEDLNSLIAGFIEGVPRVIHAAIVSSAGLPLACSEGFPPDLVDQLAAVTSGLTSMVGGAARMFGAGPVIQVVVAMERGLLIVTAISDSFAFSTLADADCDMGLVSSEMAVLGEKVRNSLLREPAGLPRLPPPPGR